MCPSKSSVSSSCVKLYLCSNPADSTVERTALRESVFPELREHCRHTAGVDLRVIDPYESSDPSQWPDENIRKQLIEECRASSAGTFLLALVGHEYGTGDLPAQVEVAEFQLLLQVIQQAGVSTKELERVYHRDENAVPPSYSLKRPHTHADCPQVREEEEDKMMGDLTNMFQTALRLCVSKGLLPPEKVQRYNRSALDADLHFALENCPPDDVFRRCLVYVHKVVNAEGEGTARKMSSKAAASDQTPVSDRHLVSELCDNFLCSLITPCQLQIYTATTECDLRYGYTTARRRSYAQSLCQQVYADLVGLIDSLSHFGNTGDRHLDGAPVREQTEQQELCAILSGFYDVARSEEEEHHDLLQIRAFVEQREHRGPLVVTGGPCAGKTVLLAHCAQQVKSWLHDIDPVVITHFSNFSNHRSQRSLLSSLCFQIASSYDFKPRDNMSACSPTARCTQEVVCGSGLCEVTNRLWALLSSLPSPKQPLVLILDGIDQISADLTLTTISSLPSPLPPSVRLILSLSSSQIPAMQAVRLRYPECCVPGGGLKEAGVVCVPLGSADRKQCVQMLTSLLSSSGRRVTSGQQALVNQALTSCRLPLFARLLHAHASLWRSDSDVSEASLPDGVHSSISALLLHLEEKHTSCLVARAVSYLTLSEAGLTETELADLLSGDGRVTQVDVERLLLDLRNFLVRRAAAGSQVLFWVSRHFTLVVTKTYLGAGEVRRQIHSEMAAYFSRRRTCANAAQRKQRTPWWTFVSPLEEAAYVRSVRGMLHHLQQSDRAEMERDRLMSFELHRDMVRAGLLGDLVTMLEREEGLFLRERAILAGVLRSSGCFLRRPPRDLSSWMEANLLPHLDSFPVLRDYVREIRRQRCGGVAVVLAPAPSSVASVQHLRCEAGARAAPVTGAAAASCGVVVEVMADGSAWTWNGFGCTMVRLSATCEREEVRFVGVKSSDRLLLLSTHCHRLFTWDASTAQTLVDVTDSLRTESHRHTWNNIKGFVTCRTKLGVCWEGESWVSVFDTSSETSTVLQCRSCVTCVAFSPSGSHVYCGQEDGTLSVFNADIGSLLSACSNSNRRAVVALILGGDEQEMACVDESGGVALWEVAGDTQSLRLTNEGLAGAESSSVVNTDHSEEINMLLVCQENQVCVWDTCEWELCERFLAPKAGSFLQAVLSDDGHHLLALLDTHPLVFMWSVCTGACVLCLDTNKPPVSLLKSSIDVMCVTGDGGLCVWDSEMLRTAAAAPKMARGVKAMAVAPTGRWLYTADGSDTVWRWSLETGLPCDHFLHDGPVENVRLSQDNSHLAVLSGGDIHVWRTETGRNILRISGSKATDILISPNSNLGVSLSPRGTSRVWKLARGSVVCNIHLHLSDAQVSPESTFLLGVYRGDLLAASMWSGAISKRFSRAERSERVVAFQALCEQPDFVLVMGASGGMYTWKLSEETVCRHLQLPETFYCRPQDFQMSSDGSYALLSTADESVTLLDLSEVRLCSLQAGGALVKACLNTTGRYAAYVSRETRCSCHQRQQLVLTVVRLSDGERVGRVSLSNDPLTLIVSERDWVFVGFEDGSVGVYSISDMAQEEGAHMENLKGLDRCHANEPVQRFPLAVPSLTWS